MISVLTPVNPAQTRRLGSAYASLVAQELDWEWIVQVDGSACDLPLPQDDERIVLGSNGRALGISATRNRALLRASGSHIFALDADDELLPGGLAQMRDVLHDHPTAVYTLGQALDLFPDGQRLFRFTRRPYPAGGLAPGRLETEWRTSKNLFAQPGATLYRRESVLAVGGWPAITGMEDLDLLLAVSAFQWGVFLANPVYLYRQHRSQTTRTDEFEREREDHREWCSARLRALRAVHGAPASELAGLKTPIPNADEINAFTTLEWQAAISTLQGEV